MSIRIILLLAFTTIVAQIPFSQTPQGINYQAVAHDNTGAVMANISVNIRISIVR